MGENIKILAASDLHGDERAVKRLAEKAQKYDVDVVVIAGDITVFDNSPENMVGPFLEKGKKVIFVPGNHDSPVTAELISEKYRIANIQRYTVSYKGVGFFGCGGADIGPNRVSERDIGIYLKKGFSSIRNSEKIVMVSHMHPEGGVIEKMSFRGSRSVKKAIEDFQPDIHICGHIHEAEGVEEKIGKTKVFCVGPAGKVIEV